MPIAIVGTIIARKAPTRRAPSSATGCSASGESHLPITGSISGNPHASKQPPRATVISAAANALTAFRMRCAQRAARTPPNATPNMKAASTSVPAHTVLPNARPSPRNQSTSNSSPAAPETKNASGNLDEFRIDKYKTTLFLLSDCASPLRSSHACKGVRPHYSRVLNGDPFVRSNTRS